MNSRATILDSLWAYLPHVADIMEAGHVLKTIDFIARTPNAFERQHQTLGHVGASAVVINPHMQQILLSQHTVLNQLSFFGNHCDGSENLPAVAIERVAQDAGELVAQSCILQPKWLDVDVHFVPAHQRSNGDDVPAHLHYDIAFLFFADLTTSINTTTRWVDINKACKTTQPDSQFSRIISKLSI